MSLVFNMVGGGSGGGSGPSASDAILTVTVPTGSTVTMTKGSVTLTPTMWTTAADATQECALFSIPSAQFDATTPWTVAATLGTATITKTVIIDSNKQYEEILGFVETWLFRNGTAESITGGVDFVAGSGMSGNYIATTQSSSTGNYWQFRTPLNVLSYGRYMHYRFLASSILTGFPCDLGTFSSKLTVGTYNNNAAKRAVVKSMTTSSAFVEGSIDLLSLTLGTEYYIGLLSIATTALESMWLSYFE